MTALATVAPSVALQPWERRPDEPWTDWLAFVAWLLTRPRPPVLPEGSRAAAVQWEWLRRAAMAEVALAPREDPAAMHSRIAMNMLTTIDREVAARCAESLRDPGRMSDATLIRYLGFLADAHANAPRHIDGPKERFDVRRLTREEAITFARLCAKARVVDGATAVVDV